MTNEFEGVSRTHMKKVAVGGPEPAFPTLFAYKVLTKLNFEFLRNKLTKWQFLSQYQDLIPKNTPTSLQSETTGVNWTVPFEFAISRRALTRGTDVPHQCLQLPPTLCVGPVLKDDVGGKTYAQPNIGYYLIAEAEIRNADQETTTVTATQEITIWVSAAANPPLETRDFPGEFIENQTLSCRLSRLRSDKYEMTLTTAEPPAVTYKDRKSQGVISSNLSIRIEDSRPEANADRMMAMFQKVQIKIILGLRAKTFFSARPFPKLPGQSLLTIDGPHRLYDEIMALPPVKHTVGSWKVQSAPLPYLEADFDQCKMSSDTQKSSQEQTESMSTSAILCASVPIIARVPMDLPPSFCSAVASRQYSLILKGKISGAYVKDFVLEVPVQIVYNINERHDNAFIFELSNRNDDSDIQDFPHRVSYSEFSHALVAMCSRS